MKIKFGISSSLVLGTLLSTLSAQAVETDLYVMAGQSNMVGRGEVYHIGKARGASVPHASIWMVGKKQFEPMKLGVNNVQFPETGPAQMNNFGTEYSFSNWHGQQYPSRAIKIIKYAKGGTSILNTKQWNPYGSNNLFTGLMSELEQVKVKEGASVRMRCFVWIQGEADRLNDPLKYEINLKKIIAEVKKKMNSPSASVVLVQLSSMASETFEPETQRIRLAQLKIAEDDRSVRLVSADDLDKDDEVHYTSGSLLKLGRRIFRACHD